MTEKVIKKPGTSEMGSIDNGSSSKSWKSILTSAACVLLGGGGGIAFTSGRDAVSSENRITQIETRTASTIDEVKDLKETVKAASKKLDDMTIQMVGLQVDISYLRKQAEGGCGPVNESGMNTSAKNSRRKNQ